MSVFAGTRGVAAGVTQGKRLMVYSENIRSMVSERADHLNSFDALRLLGAMLVLVGHAYPVGGEAGAPCFAGIPINQFGVMIFFAISGYLITKSLMADSNLGRFAVKRALRIMPALVVLVLITVFVAGPAMTVLSIPAYLASPQTWLYLTTAALWPQQHLPGVLVGAPFPFALNASLWTLPVEVTMYALTPVILWLASRSKPLLVVLVFGGGALGMWLFGADLFHLRRLTYVMLYGVRLHEGLQYMPDYALGSLFAIYGLQNLTTTVSRIAMAICAVALLALTIANPSPPWPLPPWNLILATLPICGLTLFLGLSPILYSRLLRRIGDMSYGVYLWGFLVEQMIVQFVGVRDGMAISLIATPICLALGFVSWRLIEKPALGLKPSRRDSGKASAGVMPAPARVRPEVS